MVVPKVIAKYTPERIDKLLNAIRAGNYHYTAARFAGIDKDTFDYWMHNYPDFAEEVETAQAAAEVKNVAIIQLAAQKRWTAAAWWLERQFPEKWGKVDRVEMFLVKKQAEAMVEELSKEGITITYEEVMRERDVLLKRSQHVLPAPNAQSTDDQEAGQEDAA